MPPRDGMMTWAEAVAGPLAGASCLWQDLDGLHVETAPDDPPPASILWAWRDDGWLIRLRLDDGQAYVAVHDGTGAVRTVPWGKDDGRIAARRGPGAAEAIARYEQVVDDGIATATGPVTFIRPARDADG